MLLTHSDGTTVVHSFVDYPEQDDDVSCGIPRDSTYTTLVAEDEGAKALVPANHAAGTDWHDVA